MTWTSTPEHTPCGAVLPDKPGIVTCTEDKTRCERCDKWECPKCNHWPDNPLADVCPDCLVTVVTELRDERDELKQSVKSLVEQRDDYRGKMLYEREVRRESEKTPESSWFAMNDKDHMNAADEENEKRGGGVW